MLSTYCKKIAEECNISIGLVSKLIPTLRDNKEYVLHYCNLQLYLDHGLKIKKVHRVLKFNQSSWLKQYIDFNTEKRKHANNSFEKDFFKLMNNSVFGKTMENLRKRVDVRLVTNEKKLDKLTSKPTFVSSKIFNENLMAVHKVKETLTLNRPAYVGMCILDLSKTLMYDFHHNYIKKKYNNRARLLFTDTDSFTYEIEAEDVYKAFWNDKDMFDNSDYLESSPYYCNVNKKILGKFKDEACGIPVTEFIGLKSKMYSYVKDNEKGGRTAKGIKKNVIKNNTKHEDYKNTLINNEQIHHKMKTIRSQRHQLGSYEIKYRSAVLMTSATSMIMDNQLCLSALQNITIGTNPFVKHISLHTSGQDIDSLYFFKISASILLDKISILFTFAKYRPPYFWRRYDFLM